MRPTLAATVAVAVACGREPVVIDIPNPDDIGHANQEAVDRARHAVVQDRWTDLTVRAHNGRSPAANATFLLHTDPRGGDLLDATEHVLDAAGTWTGRVRYGRSALGVSFPSQSVPHPSVDVVEVRLRRPGEWLDTVTVDLDLSSFSARLDSEALVLGLDPRLSAASLHVEPFAAEPIEVELDAGTPTVRVPVPVEAMAAAHLVVTGEADALVVTTPSSTTDPPFTPRPYVLFTDEIAEVPDTTSRTWLRVAATLR